MCEDTPDYYVLSTMREAVPINRAKTCVELRSLLLVGCPARNDMAYSVGPPLPCLATWDISADEPQ